MSFKGLVEMRCPGGCQPFEAEVWSFVRGDRDPDLREKIMAGEMNLLICPECNQTFYGEEPLIYYDPSMELFAFVFPASYEKEKSRWQEKMEADFANFQASLPEAQWLHDAPLLFFGIEGLQQMLVEEQGLLDEVEVIEHICVALGLSLYRSCISYARKRHIPSLLPLDGAVESMGKAERLRDRILKGLRKVLATNGQMETYRNYLAELEKNTQDKSIPPTCKKQ
ncbi:MAG: hypothetical protein HY400_03285 [Elusimicrobia bacterium]|nr:hypothetical protein [Elusimicrobiota bacterium]